MYRLFDFICTQCKNDNGTEYVFEDLVATTDPNHAVAECPKCGAICYRTVNRKGPPRHVSWSQWRVDLSD